MSQFIVIILVLILGGIGIWSSYQVIKLVEEKDDLIYGIVYLVKRLKLKQSITIHYGNEKQLTFIEGKLQ